MRREDFFPKTKQLFCPLTDAPFLRLSWFSPPAWKSYSATKSCGSSSSCASRFSFEVHRLAVSKGNAVPGAAGPEPEPPVPDWLPEPGAAPPCTTPPPPPWRLPGGSLSGRSGMCGKGRLCNNASAGRQKKKTWGFRFQVTRPVVVNLWKRITVLFSYTFHCSVTQSASFVSVQKKILLEFWHNFVTIYWVYIQECRFFKI